MFTRLIADHYGESGIIQILLLHLAAEANDVFLFIDEGIQFHVPCVPDL